MLRARLAVLASALCFSTTGTAQALGPDGASPVTVGAARVLVGAVGLALVAHLLARRRPPSAPGHPLRTALGLPGGPGVVRAAWVAGLAVAGYQVCFFLAVRQTGVAVGTVVALGAAPVVTGALGRLRGQGSPGPRWAVATALAAAGLTVLVTAGRAAHVDPVGVLLALGAAGSYAAYTVAAKRLLHGGVRAEAAMAAVFGTGAVWLLPAFALAPVGWMLTPSGLAVVGWLGLVPTTLAYVLFARGLARLSAAETTTLVLAEPLTAAILGIALLGEPVTAATLVGGGLVVAGLVVTAAGRGPRPAATSAAAPAAVVP